MKSYPKRLADKRTRSGLATVELAVCLPAIVILVLGAIEACSMIYLNQTLSVSGFEGLRMATKRSATSADAIARANEILTARQVTDAVVTLDPAEVASLASGTEITLSVSAPCNANAILPAWFFGGQTITASSTMVKD